MKRFMIFGSFSGTNAGDTAVLYSIIDKLEQHFPGSLYYVPTTVPSFFRKLWQGPKSSNVRPISMRVRHGAYGFISLYTLVAILRCDCIFTTANMFFDRNLFSPWNNLVGTLLPVLVWYRLFHRKKLIIAACITANSPTTILGKFVLRLSLSLHNIILVRDSKSITVLEKLGINKNKIHLSHDVVLGTVLVDSNRVRKSKKQKIGINISSYFEGELTRPRAQTVQQWSHIFASIITRMVQQELTVEFLLTSSTDRWIAEEINKHLKRPLDISDPGCRTFQEIITEICSLNVYITMRMHGAIFALNCGTPVIGLCFTEKMYNFFSDMNLKLNMIDLREMVLPPDGFEVKLLNLVSRLLKSSSRVRQS